MTSLPPRISGALSGHYRLEDEIGAGGMATVFLAHDLRHDRRVAVKVLRPELAAVIGAERFLAEIKLTANLQHPHILPLFDSGEADSFLYYVMPFVQGESLRDRLRREKQLPVEDAVRIAREVADALDYAHRHGVIHRDIKPENILLHDGRALVADFGIALAASKAGGTRMTETGMSLGTPHYMSPEQAMGEREITARSDVYALGAVLYEMLSGDPPFTGSTAQAVVARVVTEAPRPLLPQRHTIPPQVEAAVLKALEKLPADRFASAAQFAEALVSPMATRPTTPLPIAGAAATSRPWSRLGDPVVLGLAAVAVAALGFGAWQLRRPAERPLVPVRFLYTGTDSAEVVGNFPWPAAISPDGSTVVYSVTQPGGGSMLYYRRMDQLEGHPIPGTLAASQALFSPDGQWIAFEADNKERKVRLDGSAPATIAAGGGNNGADWTTTDELVVGATDTRHGLLRVGVAGGELEPLTHPDSAKGELEHLWPIGTPDGRAVVFTVWKGALGTARLAMVSLDGGPVTPLDLKGIRPLRVLEGTLLYVQADGAVMAARLDVARKRVSGKPVPVLDPVAVDPALNGNSAVFVSSGGALVTGQPSALATLTWVSRDGVSHPIGRERRNYSDPRLSPDGRRIAVILADGTRSDVWIYDLDTETLSRLTTVGSVTSEAWSGDGKRLIYSAVGTGSKGGVWAQAVGGAAAPEPLAEVSTLLPLADVAPDGHSLLLQVSFGSGWDIDRVVLDSSHALRRFVAGTPQVLAPRFSPDGRWVAMVGLESGSAEVYVRSYPAADVKLQVSVGGGVGPVWSADGTRLYYVSGTAIMEARLATAPPGIRIVSRDTAFRSIRNGGGPFTQGNYDVSRDGSRIVIPYVSSTAFPLVIVPNWLTELRQRLATGRR
ncbi:MAG TPA: protein kinase [Gemmatimonadales bacterium]|nr:protein kinase [Gemmatimonadales bacterium]